MVTLIKLISYIGLGLSIIPAILVFQESITADTCKTLMTIGTIMWFTTAPSWMNKAEEEKG
jgi:EamA domain-containing membrane protein RarD